MKRKKIKKGKLTIRNLLMFLLLFIIITDAYLIGKTQSSNPKLWFNKNLSTFSSSTPIPTEFPIISPIPTPTDTPRPTPTYPPTPIPVQQPSARAILDAAKLYYANDQIKEGIRKAVDRNNENLSDGELIRRLAISFDANPDIMAKAEVAIENIQNAKRQEAAQSRPVYIPFPIYQYIPRTVTCTQGSLGGTYCTLW